MTWPILVLILMAGVLVSFVQPWQSNFSNPQSIKQLPVLKNHNNIQTTGSFPENLAGQPALIYFGFTGCTNRCPRALSILRALREDHRLPLQFVFIHIDKRPASQAVRTYLQEHGIVLMEVRWPASDSRRRAMEDQIVAGYNQMMRFPEYASPEHRNAYVLLDARGKMKSVYVDPEKKMSEFIHALRESYE